MAGTRIQKLNVELHVYLCACSGIIECKEPLAKLSEKIGSWRVKEGGKPSHTTFERVSFNGDSSVVKCKYLRVHSL